MDIGISNVKKLDRIKFLVILLLHIYDKNLFANSQISCSANMVILILIFFEFFIASKI